MVGASKSFWLQDLALDAPCGNDSESFMRLARSGKRISDSGMYVNCGGGFSGTWRARLRAEARTRKHDMVRTVESVDMSASWDPSQARVVSMSMSWHARRSQSAPLGRPRRSALL